MWPAPLTFGLFAAIAFIYRFRPEVQRPMMLMATIGIMTGSLARLPLAVKHQLLILRRARQRAPYLTSWNRQALGVCTLLVSPNSG
jgi:hypothetical protein